MKVVKFKDGLAIHGVFPHVDVTSLIGKTCGQLPLTIADPPYGNILDKNWDRVGDDDRKFCEWMINWTTDIEQLSLPGSALYVYGGIGKPQFRPFFRYLVEVERLTGFRLSTLITWGKKRGYGIQWGYLFTREELAYFVLGDHKKPRLFNVPLLDKKRGYEGYNFDYPAKSEFLRRTNVWTDITEILRGKVHEAEKPRRMMEVPIETHTKTGEWVLDPFAGSGTTAKAARALNRKFVVVESCPKEFEKMVEGLK